MEYSRKDTVYCKICNEDTDYTWDSFPRWHLKKCHNMNLQEYYDKHIKKNNENICKECGKKTTFIGIRDGYRNYCCQSCAVKSKETQSKLKNTYIVKFGVKHPLKSKKIIDKIKKTNIEKYGVECTLHYPKSRKKILENKRKKYIERIKIILPKNYIFLKIIKSGQKFRADTYKLLCDKKHKFKISKTGFENRILRKEPLCIKCNPILNGTSFNEKEIINFITENYKGKIITNSKQIIPPQELDIYIPDLKLAFEFNGLYWHSEIYKPKNYHLDKTELCESKGISLIHVYEDDWKFKTKIVKSRILNLLVAIKNKIYARKCSIKEVSFLDSKIFLNVNHLQGNCVSKYRVGLYYKNELVSLMTFGKLRKNLGFKYKKGSYELLRFCNKIECIVSGAASKLFAYYLNTSNNVECIVSYADRSWSNGRLYDVLGFKFVNKTIPNYFYVVDGCRKNRFVYRKSELIKEGFSTKLTEHEIMLKNNIFRLYDSGQLKYVFIHKNPLKI